MKSFSGTHPLVPVMAELRAERDALQARVTRLEAQLTAIDEAAMAICIPRVWVFMPGGESALLFLRRYNKIEEGMVWPELIGQRWQPMGGEKPTGDFYVRTTARVGDDGEVYKAPWGNDDLNGGNFICWWVAGNNWEWQQIPTPIGETPTP